jgi:RNA polymerase sigma factor (sigma-70 family)
MATVTHLTGETVGGARDERWFTAVYAAHYRDVVRYGHRRLGDLDASTELAQDVFVVAWRRRALVPDRSLPWLYGVARRLLANQWRARRNEPGRAPIDADHIAAGAHSVDPDTVAAWADLSAALARLRERDREVLRLSAWEQLTIAELAVALGSSQTAAKVRLHRARRRLAAAMTRPRSAEGKAT